MASIHVSHTSSHRDHNISLAPSHHPCIMFGNGHHVDRANNPTHDSITVEMDGVTNVSIITNLTQVFVSNMQRVGFIEGFK